MKGESDEHTASVVVASIQTISRPTGLQRVTPDFRTLVIDETHHVLANRWTRTIEHFGAFKPDGPLVVGLTATPYRGDGADLGEVFEAVVFERATLDMAKAGYLADIRSFRLQIDANLDAVKTRAGDLSETELEAAMLGADAPARAVAAYQQHTPGCREVVFTAGVKSSRSRLRHDRTRPVWAAPVHLRRACGPRS